MPLLNNSQFHVLTRSLDAASLRQKVIANNVSNVDTPYFKRSDVNFEQMLQQELEASRSSFVGYRTDPRHLFIGGGAEQAEAAVFKDEHTAMNNNMNNVDMDREMSLMAQNQLRYNVLIQQMNHELRQLRTAINGKG